jgi:hypothetical protein
MDYNQIFPELNGYLIRPLLVIPPMCSLKELQDGTYTIRDLEVMHQIIELRAHMNPPPAPDAIPIH